MSGHSGVEQCPECEENKFFIYTDTKSNEFNGDCISCGYYTRTFSGYLDEEELQELRETLER